MSRLVQPSRTVIVEHRAIDRSGRAQVVTQAATAGGDNYTDRIAKYIPAEVMTGYMSLDRLLVPSGKVELPSRGADAASVATAQGAALENLVPYVPMAVFVFALVLTPLYIMQLARRSEPGTPWITHAVMATLAFFVWSYTMQGSIFVENNLYYGTYAGTLLVAFSLVSGLFTPSSITQNA